MEDLTINGAEQIDFREMYAPPAKIRLPKVDLIVSKIVGKTVTTEDPRLLKLIVSWKRNKPMDSLEPDNFFQDPAKIKQLKEIFI
jgi:hypothetical protein